MSGKDLKVHRLKDSVDHITDAAARDYSEIAPKDSVLVLVRGMGLVNSFAASVIDRPMAFNQDLKALIPNGDLLTGPFLLYALAFAGPRMLQNVSDAAHGTKRISQEDLERFELPIPPISDQSRIVEVLDRCSTAVELERTALSKTENVKRSAMRELFTCGLRGQAQQETPFGPVPEDWGPTILSHLAEVQTGAAKGRKFADSETVDVPYLRVANVQDGHLDLREIKTLRIRKSEVERYRLRESDVVLTEGGDFDKLGRGFVWRDELPLCIHQNHVFAVRTNRKALLPEFFAYQAQSPYGKAYFLQVAHKTTNLACINSNKLKAFPVLVPPTLDEQQQIVEILDAIDQKLAIHKQKRAVLEEFFKALLHKLMMGEIRVSDLNVSALDEVSSQVSA